MSLHKLTAGDGYTYLTRQVAALDSTVKGHTGLADYYGQQGEAPGKWIGGGLAGLGGVAAGDTVSVEQMKALFGEGRHPNATAIEERVLADGGGTGGALGAAALGRAFPIYDTAQDGFRARCAEQFAAFNTAAGLPRDVAVPAADRARIRSEIGRDMFTAAYGRPPADARELSGFIARASRPVSTAVAGYDLTFSPVKSVSALWALAPREVSARFEAAHYAAVADTLAWLEARACFTRTGAAGVRQVETTGMLAAVFTHRDSRAGDPDLHTHVAVSNKVQTRDGRWLALDGRVLHKAAVAASERYNTRLEAHLVASLGVRFAERPGGDPQRRPVREIVGVDERLLTVWSSRRAAISIRRGELAGAFQRDHGRPPTAVEAIALAQQATLETRAAKHAPRSLAEQRQEWRRDAIGILDGPPGVARMLQAALTRRPAPLPRVTRAWVNEAAGRVLATVSGERATWQLWHVQAEAERQVRTAGIAPGDVEAAVTLLAEETLNPRRSLALGTPDPVDGPAALRRSDGASVYTVTGSQLYTSQTVVDAEQLLLSAAGLTGGRVVDTVTVELAVLESAANGMALNTGQAQLVRDLATSGARLQLAIAPAGSGKTTTMRILARAWADSGGDVIGLAPSAVAAAGLAAQLGGQCDTLAKLTWSLTAGALPQWVAGIGPRTLVVIDEAGMAGTTDLAQAVSFTLDRGGSVRLIGDDRQLAAVAAGGVLRDIADTHGAATLTELIRFTDPTEAAATLALRAGDPAALGFYLDRGRIHVGDDTTTAAQAYTAWAADRAAGLDAVMLAPTRDLAAELNARARTNRITATGGTSGAEVELRDGNRASAGDVVTCRRNDRTLPITATDWVKNGDRFNVREVTRDGGLAVTHRDTRRHVTLPAAYVRAHVDLGYAATVHTAQGITADTCHTVLTGAESRQLLYVAVTRGRTSNHLYLTTAGEGDPHSLTTPHAVRPPTPTDVLTSILNRDDAHRSATSTARDLADPATALHQAVGRYNDALAVAAETVLGPATVTWLDDVAEWLHTGLRHAPAWPTLRGHLALLALDGSDPVTALNHAADARELTTAADPAAVLDWRLNPAAGSSQPGGPLSWLPAVPPGLAQHPQWGGHLAERARLVNDYARQVRDSAEGMTPAAAPAWATPLLRPQHTHLRADLAVWRAATGTPAHDRRPTGPPAPTTAERHHQAKLDVLADAVTGRPDPYASATWAPFVDSIDPRIRADEQWPDLAEKLNTAHCNGIDVTSALTAAAHPPLPDDLPAAALWWRLAPHLTPAAPAAHDATRPDSSTVHDAAHGSDRWTELAAGIDPRLSAGPEWPQLAAAITRAHDAGYNVAISLPRLATEDPLPSDRPAAELYWRLLEDCHAAEPPRPLLAVPAPAYVPHHIRHPHQPPPYLRTDHCRDLGGPAR